MTTSECAARLCAADNVLIFTHRGPDGDTVGSAAALCAALRILGKTAFIYRNSEMTPKLAPFAAPYEASADFGASFFISVDMAAPGLFTADTAAFADKIDLCIDHHPTNSGYARETYLDARAAACAEAVYSVISELGLPLTSELALPLYLGLSTDTGCFRYASVTPRTLRCAADMLSAGIDFYALNRSFFQQKTRSRFAIERTLTDNMLFLRPDIVVSSYSLADIAASGADEDDLSNLAGVLMQVEGVRLVLLLRQQSAGQWKLSARCVPALDVSALCGRFGGGGHHTASGATLDGSLEEVTARLSAAVAELI